MMPAWCSNDGRAICTVVPDLHGTVSVRRQFLWTVRELIGHRLIEEGREDDFEAAKAAARQAARGGPGNGAERQG